MIYITTSKADGSPCERVYEGTKFAWYYCKDEKELFASLLNLVSRDRGFKIYNVYGVEIWIPNDPERFYVEGEVREIVGIAGDPKRAVRLISKSCEFTLRGRRVKARFREEVPLEEVLRAGVIVLEPLVMPRIYSGLKVS